ncbi:hypothetical protein CAPTEDRAFT_148419 [Capitella teleta]|uniref:Rap-GAP domain-containing protein n=1 Tax=Capitella teleta TaxID=283909 RepID=R7TFC8_CAPTE|nr:hypothetical protein CAPTEDRAFT_148419 [Capitella teleta]|eukprot:ELT92478.1 hypothetical protein CAPTEDRAFT_148419 [Capitella teleta]
MDTVLCYTYLPSDALHPVTVCLCKIVNVEKFSQDTWMLMRKLLGTHLGHSGIYTMCSLLQDKLVQLRLNLMRGAVFFIGMALWGSKKVVSLKHPPSAVLPFFKQALENSAVSGILAYEVVLSCQRLIGKYGQEQQVLVWDLILDILEMLLKNVEVSFGSALISNIHDMLTTIETLHEQGLYNASIDRLFSIIEICADKRPESSIRMLVAHKAEGISPENDGWISALRHVMDCFFRKEIRTKIRLQALEILKNVLSCHFSLYEDELMKEVVIPTLCDVASDTDEEVTLEAIQLLIDTAAKCHSNSCMDLLEILSKFLASPRNPTEQTSQHKGINVVEVKLAVSGLVTLFKNKLFHTPSSHAAFILEMLLNHFKLHYQFPSLLHLGGAIRVCILECFLELRADVHFRVGLPTKGTPLQTSYSPFILCTYRIHYRCDIFEKSLPVGSRTSSPHPASTSPAVSRAINISYAECFHCFRICLEQDLDWGVLSVVLGKLPLVVRSKSLILATFPEDFGWICKRLCSMVRGVPLPEKLINKPSNFSKSDFHAHIFPVLTCFVSYQTMLDKAKQHDLVKCLEFGLVSKCAQICVRALTVCLLEMKDMMMRQLPSVLIKLSQISATVPMAIPLMEFLSRSFSVPNVFGSFTAVGFHLFIPSISFVVRSKSEEKIKIKIMREMKDYSHADRSFVSSAMRSLSGMSFSHWVFRVLFIINLLILSPIIFIYLTIYTAYTGSPSQSPVTPPSPPDDGMMIFHKELVETCVDMMSRYAFSTCSSMPKRCAVAEFLLKGGQSKSWLLGNSIVTITTSGGSEVGAAALCDRCLSVARLASAKGGTKATPEPPGGRRRHKSAAVRSVTENLSMMKTGTQDDIQLRRGGDAAFDALLTSNPESSLESLNGEQKSLKRLESRSDKINAVDHVLMGLKGESKSIFGAHLCNCWCTLWAEIHIRRPTGNLSWMMRIQNQQDLAEAFPDFSLADISSLFMSTREEEEALKLEGESRIDGLHLQEKEYESLLQEHFDDEIAQGKKREDLSCKDLIEEKQGEVVGFVLNQEGRIFDFLQELSDETQLQKSNSSPELLADSAKGSSTAPSGTLKPPLPKLELKLPSNPELSNSWKRSGTVPSEKARCTGIYEHKASVNKEMSQGGINPSFLFLQLFHSNKFGFSDERPLALPQTEPVERSLKMLDYIYPYETHKIGVLYVGPCQANQQSAILGNVCGSERYISLLEGLGSLIHLPDCLPENTYLGGLDREGNDGKFAYVWQEEFIQVVFHVATLMPNKDSDPNCNAKKLHIGNDYVSIVYNDSRDEHRIGCIKCQFDYVNVVVTPLDHNMNYITVQTKDNVEDIIGHTDTKIVSDANVAVLVRQMALHADLASTIMQKHRSNPKDPYASNWLERLRQIKRIRSKVIQEGSRPKEGHAQQQQRKPPTTPLTEDFTDFV